MQCIDLMTITNNWSGFFFTFFRPTPWLRNFRKRHRRRQNPPTILRHFLHNPISFTRNVLTNFFSVLRAAGNVWTHVSKPKGGLKRMTNAISFFFQNFFFTNSLFTFCLNSSVYRKPESALLMPSSGKFRTPKERILVRNYILFK